MPNEKPFRFLPINLHVVTPKSLLDALSALRDIKPTTLDSAGGGRPGPTKKPLPLLAAVDDEHYDQLVRLTATGWQAGVRTGVYRRIQSDTADKVVSEKALPLLFPSEPASLLFPKNGDPTDLRSCNLAIAQTAEEVLHYTHAKLSSGSVVSTLPGFVDALQARLLLSDNLKRTTRRRTRFSDENLREWLDAVQKHDFLLYGSLLDLQKSLASYDTRPDSNTVSRLLTGEYRALPGYDYSKLRLARSKEVLSSQRRTLGLETRGRPTKHARL